jgi:DNA-binding MarR family transcriptional regulator
MELDDGDSSDNPPLPEDSPLISQFIENMGLNYQHFGLSRSGERILELSMITPQTISSQKIAEALKVSRSSVSANVRRLQLTGIVERVALPGSQVDSIIWTSRLQQKPLELRMAAILPLKTIAEQAGGRMEEMKWDELVDTLPLQICCAGQSLQEVPVGSE